MTDQLAHFLTLIERTRTGDAGARRELYETYASAVARAVRRRLHPRMRSVFDSRDFAQDVWASFFALPPEKYDFPDPDHLANFLQKVAANKVTEQFRKKMLGTRENMNREAPPEALIQLFTGDPTPSQCAVANEGWSLLLAGQPPMMKTVLGMLREGYSYAEVGNRTGLHPKAIQRHVKRLTKRVMP